MDAYASLEIGLRRDVEDYRVELRFSKPDDSADPAPEGGIATFDLDALHKLKANAVEYGKALAKGLFGDPAVRTAYARACGAALDRTLRIRLFIDRSASELHQLRWETLRDPQDGSWILTKDHLLFSRHLRSTDWRSVKPRRKDNLRTLVVISSPRNLDLRKLKPINVQAELALAKASLGSMFAGELVSDPNHPGAVTLENILVRLREGFDLLYLLCHGSAGGAAAAESVESVLPVLFLENEKGDVALEPGVRFAEGLELLGDARPSVVVLASCQGAGEDTNARTRPAGMLAALGPRLAEAGIPAVVAMQGNIFMETISRFMPAFFEELRTHGEIDRAMAHARALVREQEDAWAPTLFMRFRDGAIWYVPGFAGERAEFEQWPRLLSAIRAKRCTPILGPGLVESFVGPAGDMARTWAEATGFPLDQHDSSSLRHVAQYLATSQDKGFVWEKLAGSVKEELLRRHEPSLAADVRAATPERVFREVGVYRRGHDPGRTLRGYSSPSRRRFTSPQIRTIFSAMHCARPAESRRSRCSPGTKISKPPARMAAFHRCMRRIRTTSRQSNIRSSITCSGACNTPRRWW